ncbi:MAG: S9 family peptidase [Sphingobacteriales bacterium]|nr:S9 family peptidase [Sphingobacteriales bacterium]
MKRVIIFVFSLFTIHYSIAQKKPLDHSVYDSWQHIGERMISNDGKWVVYTIDPQQGDNELVIQSSDAQYKKTVPRGYNALITEDSRYVIFKIKPFYKDTRDARIKKKKPADMPKDSLAIVELGKEEIWKKEKVKAYKTPQKSFGWVAYLLEDPISQPGLPAKTDRWKDSTKKINDSLTRLVDSLQKVIETMPEPKKKKKKKEDDDEELTSGYSDADGDEISSPTDDKGNDLVLRNISNGEEIIFYNVLEYYFSKTNDKLLVEMTRNPRDSFSVPQVLLYDCKTGKSTSLSKSGNDFRNFAMTDDGSQIAYVAEREAKPKELQKFYKLWYYKEQMDSATLLADKFSVGMKLGMTISEFGNLNFSKSGKRLFFGTAPIQPPKDTSLVEFEHAKVDIWHYNDDYLQTVQNYPARLKAAREENFLAVYDLETKTIKQLGSKEILQVLQTNEGDGDTFVGVTDFGKRVESQWRGNTLKNIYAIDVNSAEKKLVKENLFGQVYPSSTGKYIMWYDRKARNYFAWDGSTTRNITEKIKVPLWNEEYDQPDEPNNYGVMGWHEGDSAVYVYDRYDVWRVSFNETGSKNITGFGRPSKSSYRYLKLNEDEKFITFTQPLHFRTQNQETKESSLVVGAISENAPMMATIDAGKYSYSMVGKAKNSDNIIYAKENYIQSPDLYFNNNRVEITGSHSKMKRVESEIKLSFINSRQPNYLWGTAELVNWKAYNGKDATGIVYKPENFDPKKKYPMIVYFYEKLSDGLFDYKEPAPIRSAVNVPYFVSNGYIIFMPDIEYKVGHPGQSAYDYIVSGSRALVKKGWVDSTKIAIQGHSWGGYQAAQLATMTKLFKVVWAGAPVANMTSAYGGIRWESGVNRQWQYEKGQSRIGGTLWDKLPLYLENSPLFHLDKVTAPMVMMHNDADGAVPWYQGIEMFTALRRLGKKVWMFNYNGQGHGLTQRQDMLDYHIRMQQFFDYMLKGAKPAKWITEGVPAVKKGKDWGLELVD